MSLAAAACNEGLVAALKQMGCLDLQARSLDILNRLLRESRNPSRYKRRSMPRRSDNFHQAESVRSSLFPISIPFASIRVIRGPLLCPVGGLFVGVGGLEEAGFFERGGLQV